MRRAAGVTIAVLALGLLGADAPPAFSIGGHWQALPLGGRPGVTELARYVLPQDKPGPVPLIIVVRSPLAEKSLDIHVSAFTHSVIGLDPHLTSEHVDRCASPTWKVAYTMKLGDRVSTIEREFVLFGNDVYDVEYTRTAGTPPDGDAEGAMRGLCGYR